MDARPDVFEHTVLRATCPLTQPSLELIQGDDPTSKLDEEILIRVLQGVHDVIRPIVSLVLQFDGQCRCYFLSEVGVREFLLKEHVGDPPQIRLRQQLLEKLLVSEVIIERLVFRARCLPILLLRVATSV